MRQIWITRVGPPEVLQVREAPDPVAAAGQVRIRVRAAGINFADLSARIGMYPDAPKVPCVVGYEVAGVVDQVGEGVTDLAIGDRAFALPKFGGYTDTLVVPSLQALKMPDKMTFEEGAALPVTYLTAHHMMLFTGNLRRGSRIFIHSAAGGVGIAAIQLAKTRDCVILGTASPGKHDFIRKEGCQFPIDSKLEGEALRAAVGDILKSVGHPERGLDLVLDPVGGSSWTDGYKMLGAGGRLVAFGFNSIQGGKTRSITRAIGRLFSMKWGWNPIGLMNDNKEIAGCNMGHLFDRLDLLRPQFEELIAMYERGEIKPHVDKTFTFDEAPAAHHYIHDRKAKGKVLLVPDRALLPA